MDNGITPRTSDCVYGKLKNFIGYTTIHGLNRYFSSKHIIGKLLWSVILVVCFGMSCRQIYELVLQYISNKVNTKISMNYDDIYFPDVTFCNLNPLSYSRLKNDTAGQKFLKELYTGHMLKNSYLGDLWQKHNNIATMTEGCGFENLDIVIVLDSSDSYGEDNFKKALNFLQALITKSDIESGSVRVGALRFSTNVQIMFNLNTYRNEHEIVDAIGSIPYDVGGTNTHMAFQTARTVMFTTENGDRPEIDNVIILFTDGASAYPSSTIHEAQLAKSEGITIYNIVVDIYNHTVIQLENKNIASIPTENYYFSVQAFDELKGFEKHIFATLCPDFEALLNIQMEFRQTLLLLARTMHLNNTNDELDGFLLACSFDGKPCNRSLIVSFDDPFYGKCHRFPDDLIKVKHAGPSNALQLIIDVNQDDYLPYIIDEAGIRLVISVHGETLSTWTDGISVATGFKTDVALRQKSRKLFSKFSGCDDSLKFHDSHACSEACIEEAIQRICNCSILDKEGGNLGLHQCHLPEEMHCSWRLRRSDENCKCKNPCRETKYEREMTLSTWPSKKYMKSSKLGAMSGVVEYSKQRDNLLMVNIFLSDLANELTEEEPAFTIENLLSNIGGTLGLWIGMSVISIGELLELLIILCRTVCRRDMNTDNEDSAKSQDTDDVGSKESTLDPCFKDIEMKKQP